MRILFYNAKGHDRELATKDLARLRITRDCLLWINAGANELDPATVPPAIRKALADCAIGEAIVRVHSTHYCLAVPAPDRAGVAPVPALTLVVGGDWLVSISDGEEVDFSTLIDNDVGESMKGKLSGSTLAAAIIADQFRHVHERIAGINREIDRLEESVLTGRERRKTLQVMAVLRRQASRLRELVDSYRAIIQTLTRPDLLPDMEADDKRHFAHLQAGFNRLEDEVSHVREAVISSFELYSTRVAQDTNRLVRTLTFVTIGVGLISALAGIFGMNFQLRLFEQGLRGFLIATGTMAAIMIVTAIFAVISYRRP